MVRRSACDAPGSVKTHIDLCRNDSNIRQEEDNDQHYIEHYDAIVIGAGISGETCAHRLRIGGMLVALVERDSIGGECAYWAAIPTALLLGPANARWRAQALSGIASPAIASPRSLTTSEILYSSLGEAAQIDAIEKESGAFIRGNASFIGRDQIAVNGRTLQAPRIVIATGSDPSIPQIPGLLDIGFWTAREATTAEAIPQSVIILGGEGQALEIGQMFRLYGANVSIITHRNHLLADEDPAIGELLAQRLTRQGIRVEMSHNVERFGREEDHACVATLDDTTEVHAQALVVATRRHPRTDGLNLERVGIFPMPQASRLMRPAARLKEFGLSARSPASRTCPIWPNIRGAWRPMPCWASRIRLTMSRCRVCTTLIPKSPQLA